MTIAERAEPLAPLRKRRNTGMKAEPASRASPDDLVICADVQGLEPELMSWKFGMWLNANEWGSPTRRLTHSARLRWEGGVALATLL